MSKRARQTEHTVSLFPFLAVLICAMGALILLLLVTTRRIRYQQVHATVPVLEEPAVEEEATILGVPQLLAPDPDDQPLEPLLASPPPVALIDPNDEWRERLSRLRAVQTDLASGVQLQESAVEQLRTTVEGDLLLSREIKRQADALESEKQNLLQTYERLQQQKSESAERAALLRRQIDESRERLADADSKFSILPYDGRTGTTRRPIIIECTATGITFVSEGVTLRPTDLDGFIPRYNPLLYASRSLSKYWERKDARSADREYSGEPYILLIVRPQGTVAYYVARALLGSIEDSFGYELVRDDQEFVWPESDPEATELCRSIVDRMLAERDELIDSIPTATKEDLGHFSSGTGEFHLDEVEQLRQPQREVTINGQRFSREPVANTPMGSSLGGERYDVGRSGGLRDSANRPTDEFGSTGKGALPRGGGQGTEIESEAMDGAEQPLTQNSSEQAHEPRRLPNPFGDETEMAEESDSHQGQPSEFARTDRGQTSPPPESAVPLSTFERSFRRSARSSSNVNSEQPQWGLRTPGGSIGYSRDVIVRVTSSQISVADETSFPITPGLSTDDLRELLAVHLDHHVQTWGEPPRGFYWLPAVKFIVSPGGNQYSERMKVIVQKWKLRSSVEYALE
ncbi:MAG: hypothetical protein KDA86_21150 [Planctomycetaceae bacterium]|nr:hypothetical protein [Planctomycetaceae bacterium]